MAVRPSSASHTTCGGPGIGIVRGSVPVAALTSAAHAPRVAALMASVKYMLVVSRS
jgi:hypothetical protein